MLTKRIIPCLDVKDGRTVKGVNFVDLRDAGDPVALAERYTERGSRRIGVFRHLGDRAKTKNPGSAGFESGSSVGHPFTVGGISSVADAKTLLLEWGRQSIHQLRRAALLH